MLTAEPSTSDNYLFVFLEANRKTCHMLTAQPSRYPFFFKYSNMIYVDSSSINIWHVHTCTEALSYKTPLTPIMSGMYAKPIMQSTIMRLLIRFDETPFWQHRAQERVKSVMCRMASLKLLVQVKCVRCPWALQRNLVSTLFGILFLFY